MPILSDRCFHCHGPDGSHREADLRLDLEEAAKEDRGGYAAFVAGDLRQSEVWQRIIATDPDLVMPPPDSHRKPLTEIERKKLRDWLLGGAKWGRHWAFERLSRPAQPDRTEHPVDAFVRQRLAETGYEPAPRAEPHTQLRRLSFGLIGMGPTADEVSAFAANPTNEAWQSAIDRLLESPHHGERLAMWWLDAARYSDTDGFQIDANRENWPWRDWVVKAFDENKPFDQFTIEQFAGDLLPDATEEQVLATCFHRNHMTNGEGGRDPEESRIDYVIDRVNTTGAVWLGLTLGCAQCHSHKFDPISQHEYYSLAAFFNSIDEDGRAGMRAKPYLKYQSDAVADKIARHEAFVSEAKAGANAERQAAASRFDEWLEWRLASPPEGYKTWWPTQPRASSTDGGGLVVESDGTIQATKPSPVHDDYRAEFLVPEGMHAVSGWRLEVLPHESHVEGKFSRGGDGEFVLTNVRLLAMRAGSPSEQQAELSGAIADAEAERDPNFGEGDRYALVRHTLNDDSRDGWTTRGVEEIAPRTAVFELAKPWDVEPGDRMVVVLRHRSLKPHAAIGRFRIALAAERGEVVRRVDGGSPQAELVAANPSGSDSLDASLRRRLLEQFLLGDAPYQEARQRLRMAEKQLRELKAEAEPRSVMVLRRREKPRKTHVLVRGVWDAKGDEVVPGLPDEVLSRPAEQSQSRLDLAHWLVDPENPLTARVVVNQLWQMLLGGGLVRTPEDFGLQGEMPTHPELLDWLAVELIENNWDVRHILRLIVTSETYRQSSVASEELRERDPENRLLARGPRFRLPAWMIRDNALRASGLLNVAVGGPPVKPYQPPGVWSEISMGRLHYEPSVGPQRNRRTLYAFWRRSVVPTFLFDSAQRRSCEVGVKRTNTPLHALTLLNDETMLEASRSLADDATAEGDAAVSERMRRLVVRVLSREPASDDASELLGVWRDALTHFKSRPEEARALTKVGQLPPAPAAVAPETAAWMVAASLLLNLDEAITHE
ncbi:MAG: PSD1 and planctomycete cytochrome C domain-containing protein [Planctomycetota bacterium]